MSKSRAVLEVVLVTVLILAAIWLAPLCGDRVLAKRLGYVLAFGAFVVAMGSNVMHGDGLRDIGVRVDNFLRALGWVAIPTVVLVGVLLVIGYEMESLHFGRKVFRLRVERFLWPLIQQYLLQGFLNRRLQDVCGAGRRSTVIAAAVFAGLHAPNPALVLATFGAGCFWARIFQREPNLWAVALSHVVVAFVFGRTLPEWVLPNMRVGWSFWR